MKTITALVTFTILTTAFASPLGSVETDFNNLDTQGGYHFGYNAGRIAHQEQRTPEGVVRGAYSYVDADGQVQVVTYTADKYNGFVVSGTNIPKLGPIPVPDDTGDIVEETPSAVVQDTPEVVAARAAHLVAYNEVLARDTSGTPIVTEQLSAPVQYTPEVAAARREHFNARNIAIAQQSTGTVEQIVPVLQYHPDFAPYAAL